MAILNSRKSISRVNVYFRGPPASQLWRLFLGLEGFPLGRQGTPTGPIPFPRLTLEVLQTESCVPGSQGGWGQEGVVGPLPSWPLGPSGLPRCACVIVGGGGRKDCREQRMQGAGVLAWSTDQGPGETFSAQLTCIPTHDGEDDNHEVEDIPTVGEVVVAQGNHLEDTLGCEDAYEQQVDLGQDVDLLGALVVCLHHHSHHVQADEKHDGDVEGLLGHNVEYEALVLVLKGRAKEGLSRGRRQAGRPSLLPLSPDHPPSYSTLWTVQCSQTITGRGKRQGAGQPGSLLKAPWASRPSPVLLVPDAISHGTSGKYFSYPKFPQPIVHQAFLFVPTV